MSTAARPVRSSGGRSPDGANPVAARVIGYEAPVGETNAAEVRRSVITAWLNVPPRWPVALAAVVALEAAALGGLTWWAGWRGIVRAVDSENASWFALCAGGQVVAYLGYTFALRRVASVGRSGVELDLPVAFGVVSVGFSPIFSATAAGGFSIDLATLRAAGVGRERALARVLALSALEYAVLAPTVAVCGLLVFLNVAGSAPASVALPWLAVVPGAFAFAWVTSPKRARRFTGWKEAGRVRAGVAHAVAALTILRRLIIDPSEYGVALLGAALYWAGDMTTLWAALRIFDVRLTLPELVLAYGTGWALTRRSLPLGGPGLVEVLLAWVLTWFGVRFANAAAGVVAYRLFNFWLAIVPAAAVIPFAKRLRRRLAGTAAAPAD
jgi:uncharacterized membrane protein YbhN (UPF0104 family)